MLLFLWWILVFLGLIWIFLHLACFKKTQTDPSAVAICRIHHIFTAAECLLKNNLFAEKNPPNFNRLLSTDMILMEFQLFRYTTTASRDLALHCVGLCCAFTRGNRVYRDC